MKISSVLDNWVVSSLILLVLLLAVVGMWLWIPPFLMSDITDIEQRGLHGDSFGSVNSLFTGLAFAALIFTILLQQREIRLQREDLKSQMEEMRLSRAEIARQGDLQQKQIALDTASLKMKNLEVKIAEIQISAEQWTPDARLKNVKPQFEEVKQQMQQILDRLDEDA